MGGQSGEGECPTSDAPHNGGRHPPQRRPSDPHSEQRWPAQAHAVRPVLGRDARVAHPRGQAAEGGTAPDTRRPSQQRQAGPPGDGPPPPPPHAAPTGHAGQEDSVGPPHTHACAHSTWVVDSNSPPSGRAVRGGGAPDIRRPSQQWKASPRGHPSATPTASDAGLKERTLWGWCWVPTPAPTVPGTHGSRNPGYPPQRAGGWGRDSV